MGDKAEMAEIKSKRRPHKGMGELFGAKGIDHLRHRHQPEIQKFVRVQVLLSRLFEIFRKISRKMIFEQGGV